MLGSCTVMNDLARELSAQAGTSAYEEWRESRLTAYRKKYFEEMDLEDAVGRIDRGVDRLNSAFAEIMRGSMVAGFQQMKAIFADGCDDYARKAVEWEEKNGLLGHGFDLAA